MQKTLQSQHCAKIDKIVKEFSKQPRNSGDKEYGRLRFKTGLTNLTYTTT